MAASDRYLPPVEWRISDNAVAYTDAVSWMERRITDIRIGSAPETIWLLEHPPLYTAGTSADPSELLDCNRFPVFQTGRGGRYTYHGPGQRVAYAMLDLKNRGSDVRQYVYDLEQWLIETLSEFSINGDRREDRIGIWVRQGAPSNPVCREDKIAAIGVRVRKWVAYHGVSLNVEPDLSHFNGIVPCGIKDHGITSLWNLGVTATMPEVDCALKVSFEKVFGRETTNTVAI